MNMTFKFIERPPMTLPPVRPHDPKDRLAVASLAEWEVRVFDPTGSFFSFFRRHGLLHLQLWHPASGTSVLTPSRLTGGRYELRRADGEVCRAASWEDCVGLFFAGDDPPPPASAWRTWWRGLVVGPSLCPAVAEA